MSAPSASRYSAISSAGAPVPRSKPVARFAITSALGYCRRSSTAPMPITISAASSGAGRTRLRSSGRGAKQYGETIAAMHTLIVPQRRTRSGRSESKPVPALTSWCCSATPK